MYAVLFASLALLVASLAGRRAVAAAMIVALFLITTPVYGVLMGLAYSGSGDGRASPAAPLTLSQLAGLVSPMTLVDGVGQWWFDAETRVTGPVRPAVRAGHARPRRRLRAAAAAAVSEGGSMSAEAVAATDDASATGRAVTTLRVVVSKWYGNVVAVNDITMTLGPGRHRPARARTAPARPRCCT